jgi:hypothetical protein
LVFGRCGSIAAQASSFSQKRCPIAPFKSAMRRQGI